MSGIVLSAATRQSLLAAQDTASLLATTQNRLATGKKVTSALDNPLNFFTAASLDNRAGDLSNLLDNISNGIQTIQAANQGITNIQKLVDSAKSTANQALAAKSTGSSSASSATSATKAATTSIKAIATAAGRADGTLDFSGSARASFTVTDALGATTVIDLKSSTLLGKVADLSKVSDDEILAQINAQLTAGGGAGAQVSASKDLDGRIVFTSIATGSDSSIDITQGTAGNNTQNIGFASGAISTSVTTGVDATDGSTKAKVTGTAYTTADLSAADASFKFKLGDGAWKTINLSSTLDSTATGTEIAAAVNDQIKADLGLRGKVVAVWDSSATKLSIRTTASGADQSVTVQSLAGAGADIGFGLAAAASIKSVGTGSTAAASSNQREALAKQFNDLREQISQLAKDASYNGTNLLYRTGTNAKENTLHIAFNDRDTSSLDIKGVKFDADGLGISEISGGFSDEESIKSALSQLTNASSSLRSQSSTFGSNLTVVQNRQEFSKQLINVLQTGSGNLTNADLNEEAANSQALSTRQSLAISALSLANTAQQQVLQLLR